MATLCSDVIEKFLYRVEQDRKFFNYHGVTDPDAALAIAQKRAGYFLDEACGRIMLEGMPKISFAITTMEITEEVTEEVTTTDDQGNEITEEVTEEVTTTVPCWEVDLTPGEIYLLTSLMLEQYMGRDIAYLKSLNVNFTGTEMRVFDPSNARKTFMSMYETVKTRNDYLLDCYKNSDRLTGAYITIDFASLDYDPGEFYGS